MASQTPEESIPTCQGTEEVQQDVLTRVTSLPLVSSTYASAASTYASTKESHPYVKTVLDLAEQGVKHISDVAVSHAQPLMTKFEPQVSVASHYASKGLDKLEENLPILHQTADQVISDTQELVSSKVAGAKEAMAKVVHDGKELMVETRMGKMALRGAEAFLEKSEELLDHYLPVTDEELAKLAEPTPVGVDTGSEILGYFVRLGSLSTKLRHRAYQHAVAKLKAARDSVREAFFQLHRTFGQMEHTKEIVIQELQEGQEKISQIESQALATSYRITQQLQAVFKNLTANIQGLPTNLQQNLQQAYSNMEELHAFFANARSFRELSKAFLSQSQEKVLKAQEYVEDILEYVVHNTPLSWLVGPFLPMLKKSDVTEPTQPEEAPEPTKPEAASEAPMLKDEEASKTPIPKEE